MCQVGDIIVVENYSSHGMTLDHHSFIVISDENGNIQGLDYDIISVVMSSFKSDAQKAKKLSYPGNFPITPDDQDIIGGSNGKSGYVKAEQFYYFNKDKIKFRVIGSVQEDIFNLLIRFIQNLQIPIELITDNL